MPWNSNNLARMYVCNIELGRVYGINTITHGIVPALIGTIGRDLNIPSDCVIQQQFLTASVVWHNQLRERVVVAL